MARWRLTAKHYIHAQRFGEKTQWIREETNRDTGRTSRKAYDVPLYLDPDDGRDQNYPGECVVAWENGAKPQDIIFTGEPTPDMEPMDEEAEKISAATKHKWINPIDAIPATGGNYSEGLLALLTKQLDEATRKAGGIVSISPADTVSKADFEKMQADLKALMEANAKMQAQLATRPKV